ncbi:hypothetical protein, partial [Limnohabitans sp.]|uniref:hypothetical protein n=1 Tax=Limnohabitans sp. TaxID=1907725 RepID=UPI002FDE659F
FEHFEELQKIFLTASAELTCAKHYSIFISEARQFSTTSLRRPSNLLKFLYGRPKSFACTPSLIVTNLSNNPRWP